MYLQQHLRKKGNKTYKTVYLAESYRKDGKVKKRYIANLSDCPDNIIGAIKNELNQSTAVSPSKTSALLFEQGKSFGGIFSVLEVCNRLGITHALGKDIKNNTEAKTVYLYDVTSSYFEGTQNELAAFGYNRDKKKGKMQIVIGLLCDEAGYPISVQVFEGNTRDTATIGDQLKKLQNNFGIKQVVMVGDRGMIKSASIDEMVTLKWHYITAITTPQVKTLLKQGVIQLALFEEKLIEIWQEDIRYLLRRNMVRMEETAHTRNEKIEKVKLLAQSKTSYLTAHPKASVEVALKAVNQKATQLKIKELLTIATTGRSVTVAVIETKVTEAAQLDGCYILKSNVPKNVANKETLHKRYKDLAMVEHTFRTMKQSFEEMQPIYVRKESRNRGHVFVCMLSYMIIKYIWDECKESGSTQAAIFDHLSAIHYLQYTIEDTTIKKLPDVLNETQAKIINTLKIKLPTML